MLITYLWIALGSAIGGVARYAAASALGARLGEAFPWGTLAVNVTGSFAIGLFATLTAPDGRWPVASDGRLFFMVGVCGGYTTFSAFSLQTLNLIRQGDIAGAGWNIAASLVLCLLAVWLGHAAGAGLNAMKGA